MGNNLPQFIIQNSQLIIHTAGVAVFTVHFLPDDIEVNVAPGTLISDAALKAGIGDLHLPCGGKGACGKCLVEIVSGSANQSGMPHQAKDLAGKRLVASCQTKIREDIVVRVTKSLDASMRVLGDSSLLINQDLLPDREEFSPLYRTELLTVPPASIEEHYSDWQRLVRELIKETGAIPVSTSASVLRSLAEAVREQDGKITVIAQEDDAGIRVIEVHPGHRIPDTYGVAIDIGTTTIAVQLVDLGDGKILASRATYNAQIVRGADVISRIDYARSSHRQSELRHMVLDSINELIEGVSAEADIHREAIHAAFIAGNTTMIHLLLALEPRYIREAPYVPTVNTVPTLPASDVGLKINPKAVVSCAPGVGSYVGGDITAGLLCTDLPNNHEEVFMFLDIGTNGEIVLGNADWMVACACSAGPAFEGSGIKCGMRATDGAIEYMDISEDASQVTYDVISSGKPVGICGSGLIALLGQLLLRGIVDQSGHFNMELNTERLVQTDNTRGFVLEWGANTGDGNDLIITEPDIENLMRTKAAIYAACSLILGNVGLDWSVISRFYIAGGFGRYIQIDDAVLIGLLPDLPYEKFTYVGNSALTGAYIALMSGERRRQLVQITQKMTYIDLSSDPKYMDSYLGALFLPHTDIKQFPTVAAKLGKAVLQL